MVRRVGPSACGGRGFRHDATVRSERAGHDAPIERDRGGTFLARIRITTNVVVTEGSIAVPPTLGHFSFKCLASAEIAVNSVIGIVAKVVVAEGFLARLFDVDRMLRFLRR